MDTFHQRRTNRGFSFVEIVIVIAILALLAALLLPALARAKSKAIRTNCVSNLRQVGTAFRLWADDNKERNPQQMPAANGGAMEAAAKGEVFRVFQCMSNEIFAPKILFCPADIRQPAADFAALKNANISYFVGLDANESVPTMFITGDRNLVVNGVPARSGVVSVKTTDSVFWTQEMHQGEGNVGLADGSCRAFTLPAFQNALRNTGTNVNRLAFP